jgi:serine/threonine protein kinase
MTPTREDLELYVSGNYDGDVAALERAIAEDPALAAQLAEEAKLEVLLREAGAAAAFCAACDELVRDTRCAACGAALRPGGYVVERVLVSNAHGRMYVARDADGKRVALKELAFVQAPGAAAAVAFEGEAKLLRALDHAAIPRFVASFEEGTGVHARYYLAQELVEGAALDRELEQHFYKEDEVVELARAVLGVLVYLQSLSPMVIHRDVKPANLIRRADGSIALVDFGAALVGGASQGSTTIGTFGYMPVEQLAGVVDATTDVYALGTSLVHLLTRQEPWRILQDPALTMNVSAPLRAWLAKATHADPKQRFANAKDALAQLDARDKLRVPRRGWSRLVVAAASATATLVLMSGGYAVKRALEEPPRMAHPLFWDPLEGTAKLTVRIPPGTWAEVKLDGQPIAMHFADTFAFPVPAGLHSVQVKLSNEAKCQEFLTLRPGETTSMDCGVTALDDDLAPAVLNHHTLMDFSFKNAPMRDVLRAFGQRCDWNIVVPATIEATVSMDLHRVPCDETLEVMLESHGLWYEYRPDANIVRIAPRQLLDREREDTIARKKVRTALGSRDDEIAFFTKTDLDLSDVPLRSVLQTLAKAANVNLVLPDQLGDQHVTVQLHQVPWNAALQEVLAAGGLGYRYSGWFLRIGPRSLLDREDADELARRKSR